MQYLFTTWLVVLTLFYKYTSKYIDLLLLAFITFCICIYISYIYPCKYEVCLYEKTYEYSGYWLIVPDIIHLVLLIAAYFINSKYSSTNIHKILASIALLYIYILCFNIEKLYGVSKNKLYIIGSYAILVYLVYYILILRFRL